MVREFLIGVREALSELLTLLAFLALIVPWFTGAAVIVRWLWVHLL